MSRVGRLPCKVPPSVSVKIEPITDLPPSRVFSAQRTKYALRNRPSADGFGAFGQPTSVYVEGPLGALRVPVHSFCSVEAADDGLHVKPQCDGTTKMGKTLWGTTRGYIANAIRGVSQGFRKDLELHGIGFRARVEPAETAAPPANELVRSYRLGTEKYGESPFHKQAGPTDAPDPGRGGTLIAGAGGGYRFGRHALRPVEGGEVPVAGRGRPKPPPTLEPGGDALMMRIGFSHEVRIDFPPHLKVTTPSPTTISIFGIDKQQVGLAAQRIRLLRKPDAYKGKGIRYVGEVVKLKAGKRK
jgi:ribosomal protein L6P/L9E